MVWHCFLRLSFSFGSQHCPQNTTMELMPSFAWVWFFLMSFSLVVYFCPTKQICTFFFLYNYGSLQGKFLVLVFVEALCVCG
jgi:hypothetical protein